MPYKGLEYLLSAFQELLAKNPNYRLIIAGEPMKKYEKYCNAIQQTMNGSDIRNRIVRQV